MNIKTHEHATLTISEPQHVSINDGEDLSLFIAAYLLYSTFNDSHKNKQPWITKNIEKLLPLCQTYLGALDKKFVYDLKPLKKDIILKIYENI